jgi:polyisoprenoid-binding protein YceI
MTPKLCPVALLLSVALFGHSLLLRGGEPNAHFSVQPRDGSVEFLAVGWPGALSIHGKGARPNGTVFVDGRNVSGVVSLELGTLDTGIDLRNRHMKENYLQVAKYPRSELRLTRLAIPDWPSVGAFDVNNAVFEGELSLHGVTRSVRGAARIRRKADVLDVVASFEINTRDYGIETPGYMGVTVAESIKVKVQFSSLVVSVQSAQR